MSKNKLAALVTLTNGDVRRVYRKIGGGYTVYKENARGGRFRTVRKPFIRQWARKRGWKVKFTRKDNPFIYYDPTTRRVVPDLERRLNNTAQKRRRYMWIGEGNRTNYQQWEFRMAYLRGDGNLAARCCLKYWPDRVHSWADCGKQSQSNHRAPGKAADCGLFMDGLDHGVTDIGQVARDEMKSEGLCLPVPGEDWHAEVGTYWAA